MVREDFVAGGSVNLPPDESEMFFGSCPAEGTRPLVAAETAILAEGGRSN
jgi:hypothetical protein